MMGGWVCEWCHNSKGVEVAEMVDLFQKFDLMNFSDDFKLILSFS